MKSRTSFIAALFLLMLVSCAPVSIPLPTTSTPDPTAISTFTPVPATRTHQPAALATPSNVPTSTPVVDENASEDCFLSTGFVPGKTRMNEVMSVWGDPSEKSSPGTDSERWYFDFTGVPDVKFDKQILDSVRFYLKGCTLERITAQLGPPEKVEIITLVSCVDLNHIWVTQNLHYTSLGFSYFRFCDETQNCFTFHPDEIVSGKEFYASGKIIEDHIGFNMSGYVYNWHGFDVNVEEAENKIEDFSYATSTP